MMADLDTAEIIARCLCGVNNLSWDLPKSSLPLDAGICACDSCRHGTGTLGFTACTWPLSIPELPNCSKAAFSPNADVYFCATCGTTMFLHNRSLPWIGLAHGTLEDPTICRLGMHMCLSDTKDGGMAVWLESVNGAQLKKYATADLEVEFEIEAVTTASREETLKAGCRCGGVQFEISRAMEQSERKVFDNDGQKSVSPERYDADICLCNSCRLSTGCEVMAWAHIPKFNLLHNKKPLSNPPVFGTIKHYASSEGTDRYFCGECGAVIFLISKSHPELLNVAVGLLYDDSGSRAEGWLRWMTSEGPANAADGFKRGMLANDLAKQMIAWWK